MKGHIAKQFLVGVTAVAALITKIALIAYQRKISLETISPYAATCWMKIDGHLPVLA
jgi:hypothetical protein